MVIADGQTRFFRSTMSTDIRLTVLTINGGEVISSDSYGR